MAGTADGLIAGITALHAMIPAAYRPGMMGNKAKQITAVLRDGGGISEYYAELYSAARPSAPLFGATATPDALAVTRAPRHRRRPDRPHGLFRASWHAGGRHAGQVGPGQHGLRPRGARPLPRPPGRRVRLAPAAALKYCNRSGSKHLLRRLLYRHLPAELVDRPKKGFSSPMPVWLRGPLREWAEDLLDERQLAEEGFSTPPFCASAGSSISRPPRITANCSGAS